METTLIAVGKLRPTYRAVADEYLQRLTRYGAFAEREVREAGKAATPALRRQEESRRITEAVPDRARVILLDRGGSAWTSEALAAQFDRWRQAAQPIALVIGGAFGVSPEFTSTASTRWSLGPLTLAHELARVVVLEQWYRAWTILRGEPYHK